MKDLIRVYENIILPDVCDGIIKKFDADQRKGDGVTGSPDSGGGVNPRIKTSVDLRIGDLTTQDADWRKFVEVLGKGFSKAVHMYAADVESVKYLAGDFGETGFKIQCYPANEGHYVEHVDANSKLAAFRQLSCLVYLNTIQEGGETMFPFQDKKIKPKQGSVAIFPSNFAFPHKALVPVNSRKYIVVNWLGFV